VIDADAIAREVVSPGSAGLGQVVAEFGSGVLRPDGQLDRDRLATEVFADPGRLAALNAIVHPLVGERMAELERAAPPGSTVVHDVPLIAENDLASGYDLIVVVDVPPRTQLDRVTGRGLTAAQAQARIDAQATREQRLSIADIVVDNSGSLSELDRQAGDLWTELRRRLQARGGVPVPPRGLS
jgi:dephospho-CoA kinase